MDLDDIVKEVDETVEWFCHKVVEPIPLDEQSKDKVMKRMVNLGWLRQSEYEIYKDITKKD